MVTCGQGEKEKLQDNYRVSRKEVFQPHLPVRLPCYDLAPITGIALDRVLRLRASGAPGFPAFMA